MPKPFRVSDRSSPPGGEGDIPRIGVERSPLETVAKRKRRVFSASDKLRIVKEADRCLASGKRGALEAMLRREGLYSSLVYSWRAQLGAHGATGLATSKPGRKPKLSEAEKLNVVLTKRNAELERKLYIANVLIDLQKKAHEILGIALPQIEGDS